MSWPFTPRKRDERGSGSLTIGFLLLVPVLLFAAGLIVDGGRKTAADSHAQIAASEAARVGANAAAVDQLAGRPPNVAAAKAAAQSYLSAAGVTGSVTVTSGGSLVVNTTQTRPTVFLSLIGIGHVTGHGRATVNLYATGDHP